MLDPARGVLRVDGTNGEHGVAVPLRQLGAGGPGQALDLSQGEGVRVVVEAEGMASALLFYHVHLGDAGVPRKDALQPLDARIGGVRHVREEDGKVQPQLLSHPDTSPPAIEGRAVLRSRRPSIQA